MNDETKLQLEKILESFKSEFTKQLTELLKAKVSTEELNLKIDEIKEQYKEQFANKVKELQPEINIKEIQNEVDEEVENIVSESKNEIEESQFNNPLEDQFNKDKFEDELYKILRTQRDVFNSVLSNFSEVRKSIDVFGKDTVDRITNIVDYAESSNVKINSMAETINEMFEKFDSKEQQKESSRIKTSRMMNQESEKKEEKPEITKETKLDVEQQAKTNELEEKKESVEDVEQQAKINELEEEKESIEDESAEIEPDKVVSEIAEKAVIDSEEIPKEKNKEDNSSDIFQSLIQSFFGGGKGGSNIIMNILSSINIAKLGGTIVTMLGGAAILGLKAWNTMNMDLETEEDIDKVDIEKEVDESADIVVNEVSSVANEQTEIFNKESEEFIDNELAETDSALSKYENKATDMITDIDGTISEHKDLMGDESEKKQKEVDVEGEEKDSEETAKESEEKQKSLEDSDKESEKANAEGASKANDVAQSINGAKQPDYGKKPSEEEIKEYNAKQKTNQASTLESESDIENKSVEKQKATKPVESKEKSVIDNKDDKDSIVIKLANTMLLPTKEIEPKINIKKEERKNEETIMEAKPQVETGQKLREIQTKEINIEDKPKQTEQIPIEQKEPIKQTNNRYETTVIEPPIDMSELQKGYDKVINLCSFIVEKLERHERILNG